MCFCCLFQISIGKSGFEFNECTAFVTGYGIINPTTDEMPYQGVMMELSTRVYDADYCNTEMIFSYSNIRDLYPSQICADSDQIREDACFGKYLFLFFLWKLLKIG